MSDTNDSFAPVSSSSETSGVADATSSPDVATTAVFASFNILHGRVANGPVNLDAYIGAVQQLNADVVGLQEVDQGMLRTRRSDMAALAAKQAGMAHHFGKAARRLDLGKSGIAMLSRGSMAATTVRLPQSRWWNERRIAIQATVRIGDVGWTVVNTHLSLDGRESEMQLRFLVERLSGLDGPCVLMGDFNRFPDDVTSLLSAGWAVAPSDNTYPSWQPEKRIDYICVRNATVLSTDVRSTAISDHCALLATITAN